MNTIEFTYRTTGGVPAKWTYEIENTEIVEFTNSYALVDQYEELLEGEDFDVNYVFTGKKKGTTTITFYYSSLDDEIFEVEKHTVKVDKNLHITLLKTEKEDRY